MENSEPLAGPESIATYARLARDRVMFFAGLGLALLGLAIAFAAGLFPQLSPTTYDANGVFGDNNLGWTLAGAVLIVLGTLAVLHALRGGVVKGDSPRP